jgi:hypothetical protein
MDACGQSDVYRPAQGLWQDSSMSETDILAIIAIFLSAVSIIWQAVNWQRSGPVIKAWAETELLDDAIVINAYNSGRSAGTITNIEVFSVKPNGIHGSTRWLQLTDKRGKLPFLIEAGGHGSWWFDLRSPKSWDELDGDESSDQSPDYNVTVTVGHSKKIHLRTTG